MINRDRLLSRLEALSRIGRTQSGGVTRLALSPEDTAARRQVIDWASSRGFKARIDPIGNIFIGRVDENAAHASVLTGSHLDTQIDGGHFDGIYGVVAGLEVLESLDENGQMTRRPLELVIWNNEEGVRFAPVTMGSGVFCGRLSLEDIRGHTDASGISVGDAIATCRKGLGQLGDVPLGRKFSAYVEAHIEQGPVLESLGKQIGVVTGIQGVRQMSLTLQGEAAHAGTTPLKDRRDAFVEAVALYTRLRNLAQVEDPMVRFTVGRMVVLPGAPNTIPSEATFSVDFRHPDAAVLQERGDAFVQAAHAAKARVRELIHNPPVAFDSAIIEAVRNATSRLGFTAENMMSGATHDAANVARMGPTGMVFVPSREGISHSPRESTDPDDLVRGANVLAATLATLCS